MKAVFSHFSNYWWDFRHLVAIRNGVFASQFVSTAATRVRFDIMTPFNLLNWHQFPSCAFVSRLCPALAFALGTPAWLGGNRRPVTGWGPGRIARVLVELFVQSGYLCLQCLYANKDCTNARTAAGVCAHSSAEKGIRSN